VDVLNNMLLFVPLGSGLTLLGLRVRSVLLVGFLVSFVVESLQHLVISGRDPSLSDLVTNTLGSWLGTVLSARYAHVLWPGRRGSALLALAGVMVWWTVQTGTAALLRPWAPPGELRGAWARVIPGRPAFDGTVTSAFVSGVAVHGGSIPVNTGLNERINNGLVHLELEMTAGRDLPGGASIFELLGRSGDVISVEARGRDLIVQMPARAQAWRLRPPALHLAGALQGTVGTRLRLAAGERGDTLWAACASESNELRTQQILSPSLGWSLLVPFHYAYGSEVPWLTGLWLIAWMIPVAYWSARTGIGRYRLPWYLLTLLVGLGFVPHLMGYPAVPWSEWLAGAIGIGLGWAAHYCATKLQARCDSLSTNESS
jgi:hypothetical protein